MKKNETVKSIIMRCMVMRLDEEESLAYLKEHEYDLSRAQFYRIKKNIRDTRFERLSEIAKGFIDHHLERMDTLDLVNREMWQKYRKGDYKALDALSKIAETQPLISNYYDATKMVIEDQEAKIKGEREWKKHMHPPKGMNKVIMDDDGEFYWSKPDEDVMDVITKSDEEIAEFKKKYGLDKLKK
jgi:hypothetical protein